MPFQTISVIGLGYIGLPTAAVTEGYLRATTTSPLPTSCRSSATSFAAEPLLQPPIAATFRRGELIARLLAAQP